MKGEKLVTLVLTLVVISMIGLIGIQNTVGLSALTGKKNSAQDEKPKTQQGPVAANVEVMVAKPSTFIKTISVNGELSVKDSTREIPADATGKITQIFVKRGDYVKSGDVIAKADPSTPGAKYKIKDIVSNVSGTVYSVDGYVGQNVSSNTTVITVGNPGQLVLNLDIPEKYLASFSLGSEATFTTAAWPDYEYSAVVTFIDNVVNSATRTVMTELEIKNSDERLKAGMFVKSKLIVEKEEQVITVPTEAISTYLSDAVIYIVDESGTAVRTVVTTGRYNDRETVITNGLKVGDKIIVQGSVTDGTPVNVIN